MIPHEYLMNGWVNPLAFPEVDIPPLTEGVRLDSIVRFICGPDGDADPAALVSRYRQISGEQNRLFLVPAEPHILGKLIWPLRHAKASYMVGNYLGSVALCGMVAEMAAILLHVVSPTEKRGNTPDMRSFEKLGQQARVRELHDSGLISADAKKSFDIVRETRRKYLHFYSVEFDDLPIDAKSVYCATVAIVTEVIGPNIDTNGRVILRPDLLRYLQGRGFVSRSAG